MDAPGRPETPSESTTAQAGLAVVIVNWNATAVIGACIESILAQSYAGPIEIVVVDNASTDDSLVTLAAFGDRVDVIASPENLGFGRGNNVGFQATSSTYAVFLNPDTELLDPGDLQRMVARLDDPTIGLVGPRIVNRDGSTQQSCSSVPSLGNLVVSAFALGRLLPDDLRRRLTPVLWSHDRSTDTGWVGGACIVMRSADYRRIGGYSERTFMYGEDLELGYRVSRFGLRVFYDHDIRVLHLGDHSSAQRWSDEHTAARIAGGELTFLRERYGPGRAALGRRVLRGSYAARAAALRLLGRTERAGIYRAMAGALGPEAGGPAPAGPRSSLEATAAAPSARTP